MDPARHTGANPSVQKLSMSERIGCEENQGGFASQQRHDDSFIRMHAI